MPNLLHHTGAVQRRRLIDFLIHAGQRRNVQDGVPSSGLPDAAGDIYGSEPSRLRHEVYGFPSHMYYLDSGGQKVMTLLIIPVEGDKKIYSMTAMTTVEIKCGI